MKEGVGKSFPEREALARENFPVVGPWPCHFTESSFLINKTGTVAADL